MPDLHGTGVAPCARPDGRGLRQQRQFQQHVRAGVAPKRAGFSPATAPPSPTATPASSSSGPGGNSAAAATITANWEKFFSGSTSAANKIALLQNGTNYAAIIKAQSGSGLASTAGAKVKAVVVNSPTTATVSYDITLSGATALPNQTGAAVYEGGTWKVSDAAFCQLVKLENNGSAPSVCG